MLTKQNSDSSSHTWLMRTNCMAMSSVLFVSKYDKGNLEKILALLHSIQRNINRTHIVSRHMCQCIVPYGTNGHNLGWEICLWLYFWKADRLLAPSSVTGQSSLVYQAHPGVDKNLKITVMSLLYAFVCHAFALHFGSHLPRSHIHGCATIIDGWAHIWVWI